MPSINDLDRLYRRSKTGTGSSSRAVNVELEIVKPHVRRVLSHVTAENLTSPTTKVRLGIRNAGAKYYTDELQSVAANELAVNRADVVLGEADIFFVEFTGTKDGDNLVIYASGWEKDLE